MCTFIKGALCSFSKEKLREITFTLIIRVMIQTWKENYPIRKKQTKNNINIQTDTIKTINKTNAYHNNDRNHNHHSCRLTSKLTQRATSRSCTYIDKPIRRVR